MVLIPEVRVQVYINALVKHCLVANNVCFINCQNGALYCVKTLLENFIDIRGPSHTIINV